VSNVEFFCAGHSVRLLLHLHAESCDENCSEEDLVVSEDGAGELLEKRCCRCAGGSYL